MKTNDAIEAMLYDLPYPFQALGDGLWVLNDEADHINNIVIHHDHPLLTIRVKVMAVPDENREALYEALLQLNANDLVHGAYGIEEDDVVIIDTIQSPNLDLNELQGTIDAVTLALTTHYERLSGFRKKTDE